MRIHTTAGVEEIDADRLIVEGRWVRPLPEGRRRSGGCRSPTSYPETDPETGEGAGGIETVYSRSW